MLSQAVQAGFMIVIGKSERAAVRWACQGVVGEMLPYRITEGVVKGSREGGVWSFALVLGEDMLRR